MSSKVTITGYAGPGILSEEKTIYDVSDISFDFPRRSVTIKTGSVIEKYGVESLANITFNSINGGYSVSIGQAEVGIEVVTDYDLTAVSDDPGIVTIDGDYTAFFIAGNILTISGSTGNDGDWEIASSALDTGETVITLVDVLPDDTEDGTITKLTLFPSE